MPQTPQSEFTGHPVCQSNGNFGDYWCAEAGYEVPNYQGLPIALNRTIARETASGATVMAVEVVYGDLGGEYFVTQAHPDCSQRIHLIQRVVSSSVLGTWYDFNKNGVFELKWADNSADTLKVLPVPDC